MEKDYKKVSFRIDTETFNDLSSEAERQYLTVSAYIRKQLERELYKKGEDDGIHKQT